MIQKWQTLHAEMLADIEKCLQHQLSEEAQVECAFKVAGNYWQKLKDLFKNYRFKNRDEEVDFFKNIKPAFTSYIEYFTIVYSSQILKPVNDIDALQCFWEQEEKKLERFIKKNKAFVE